MAEKMVDEYDFETEVINVQFGLMMNYRYGMNKRYDRDIRRIRQMLTEQFPESDVSYINKLIEKIVLKAERTIDKSFFEAIGKPVISMR